MNRLLLAKNFRSLFIFFGIIAFTIGKLSAQKPLNPIKDSGPKSKIELIRADSLLGENTFLKSHTFLGNVIFKHNGVLLGCQKAIHNMSSNYIEAFGKIVINQGDTLTIVGDTLYYDGNAKFARVLGRSVILRDRKVTLKTTKLNYDINAAQAYYPESGSIMQDSSKLSSNQGYYNTQSKIFKYIGDVQIINPSYVLCTDSLDYDTFTKQAYFNSKTIIRSKDGDLTAYKGRYNIKTRVSKFEGRAKVINNDYSLEADTLNFNNITDSGTAFGNVVFNSFPDSTIVTGKKGERIGNQGLTWINGETVTQKISGNDSIYIGAENLWIYEKIKESNKTKLSTPTTTNKKTKPRRTDDVHKLVANNKVKIWRKDFQSISDSLIYDLKDSIITFYSKPILWNNENQLEADTIILKLKNNKLKDVMLLENSFVIEIDTIKNYNQIKGRKINAFFDKTTDLKTITVNGNGESLYFALDDKNKIIGLNRVQCSNMQFDFKDKKVNIITFRGDPESFLIPPKEVRNEDIKLEKFEWKISQKPSKNTIINKQFLKLTKL